MTAPRPDDFTDILYKYTDQNGVEKILTTGKLRFTRPSEMNDPFDVRIDEWMAMDLRQFYELAAPRIAQRLFSRPDVWVKLTTMSLQQAEAMINDFQNQADTDRAQTLVELVGATLADFDSYAPRFQQNTELARAIFAATFDTYGLFCATRTYRNLLMWAHYADRHAGVVLGLRADLTKDSMLRLTKPVRYSDQRPHAIDTVDEFIASLDLPSNEAARKIGDKLFHTKSAEWAYEEEVRLLMPAGVENGAAAGYFPFGSNELVELYLGFRMPDDKKAQIIQLAKALNQTSEYPPHVWRNANTS
jgi:hypothetical protein